MRNPYVAALFLLTCSAATPIHAEEHRHHEAHAHGGGQLNVAVEQNTLMIDLSLPAMNIVGFEHPASNENERDQVARAADLLRDGKGLFVPTPEAKCALVRSEVESALLENLEHHDDAGHNGDAREHADFEITYEFNCETPSQLYTLTLWLFERFPGTHHLRTQVITPSGQVGAELTPEKSILNLK
ncbi:MAG: DUF2796 domain-containing protein [Sedimenticola sp.]|nr:DUF2796 domain-containing protein [Sedimenticola sp.]